MAYLDFITPLHVRTQRNYAERAGPDKAERSIIAKQFGKDYWDGDRKYGYGGYSYDGRWRSFAEKLIAHYHLMPGNKILDVGCGKGFLLYDFIQALSGIQVAGIDVSNYAIENARAEIKPFLKAGNAIELPYPNHEFDLVVSINTLHNLYNYQLKKALQEIERVGKTQKYLVMDSYRNEHEKVNLMYWQLTCECFFTPSEWKWVFDRSGYRGDYGFIYYE